MVVSSLYDSYHTNVVKTKKQSGLIDESNFTYKNFFRHIFPLILDFKKRCSILDIGSGAGTISLFLAKHGYEIVGIDISQKAVEASISSTKELDLESRLSFLNIDFKDFNHKRKFDIAICLEVIEHCEEDEKLLIKVHNLLKENGLLILSTPLKTAPLHKLGITSSFDKRVGHLRRYTKDEIVIKVSNSGFKVEKLIETEGIVRNSLYVLPLLGFLIRFIKGVITDIVTKIDDISGKFFGYSDLIVIARKK